MGEIIQALLLVQNITVSKKSLDKTLQKEVVVTTGNVFIKHWTVTKTIL